MMMKLLFLFAAVAFSAAHDGHDHSNTPLQAVAHIVGKDVTGDIVFTQLEGGKVQVTGTIVGLPQGDYGFHIHEKGNLTGGCASAGSHFNPLGKQHGHPNDENRHVGDLGNVQFNADKVSTIDFVDGMICLYGTTGVIGRAVVLHERADDFGKSSHPDSRITGNAGGRVACGVIGIAEPSYGWPTGNAAPSIVPTLAVPVFTLLVMFFVILWLY